MMDLPPSVQELDSCCADLQMRRVRLLQEIQNLETFEASDIWIEKQNGMEHIEEWDLCNIIPVHDYEERERRKRDLDLRLGSLCTQAAQVSMLQITWKIEIMPFLRMNCRPNFQGIGEKEELLLYAHDTRKKRLGIVYPQVKGIPFHSFWNSKMISDMSRGCNINKYEDKRKKSMQRVSSFVITTSVILWIMMDICRQLQPEHGPIFIGSSLLELLGFMVFVCAIAAMIVVGAPLSRLQSAMLLFWSILMLLRSAESITQVCIPILGILFMGWYVLMEKQSPQG